MGFVSSNWRCQWKNSFSGNECPGILDELAPERGEGCCSVGAELLDANEARRIEALALALDPAMFQNSVAAKEQGFFTDESRRATKVIDGACIFLNRPGFVGGEGCALHLAAISDDEDPIEWKPSICWQLPLKIEEQPDGSKLLRRWQRTDWNTNSADDMAWCCTEDVGDPETANAYTGHDQVVESLGSELQALVGPEVYVELQRRCELNNP